MSTTDTNRPPTSPVLDRFAAARCPLGCGLLREYQGWDVFGHWGICARCEARYQWSTILEALTVRVELSIDPDRPERKLYSAQKITAESFHLADPAAHEEMVRAALARARDHAARIERGRATEGWSYSIDERWSP